ncbi:Cytochrome b561 [Lecanosticta acicola]|uniref:Cytochrome b561 n=1 Tax=Lecanosticta acicola TaxID=111012 RepID=A0AAI8Z650_9PEZI|nr:Cytochrome b561 [Lecanosticta acicola]
MSNAEGIRVPGTSEEEPLLGGRGDASLPEGKPLYHNFVLGTGVVAQAGAWVIAAIVWGAVFSSDLMLFSAHPLLNSAAFLFLIQALLILQPTHTAKQKKQGTYVHAALNDVALLAAIAGLIVIEYNKIDHNGAHFESTHAILGLITYILIFLQAFVGVTQFFTPGIYGGVENAKAFYKYHRLGGYITTVLMMATICAATQTTFNVGVLGIQLWAVIVASVVVLVGLIPRIRLNKLGWLAGK